MSTFQEATGQSIESAFKKFHDNNPKVYMFFKEQCFRAIRRGKNKISSKQILGYIRWEISMDIESDDGFKINDAFTSHYSRIFAKEYPEHEDLFNFRELRDGSEDSKERKKLITGYQHDILSKISEGQQLWLINNEYKLIEPVNKVQHKVELRAAERLIHLKMLDVIKKEDTTLFGIHEHTITKKGNDYLTGGKTP